MSMTTEATSKSHRMLFMNTFAFTVAFAAWMLNGVLVTFLVSNGVYNWSSVEMGTLIGTPILTGALFRLPLGIMTDKFGGKPIFTLTLLVSAVGMFMLSKADSYSSFLIASLVFGTVGATFAVGIAFTSVWYPKKSQGLALGIFGAGNAGAAFTVLVAPSVLKSLVADGNIDAWRTLPLYYAVGLVLTAIVFFLATENKKPDSHGEKKTLRELLRPLKDLRVWELGMFYFIVFGLFIAFSQWLVPYFVNVYGLSLVTAGLFAAAFSFPSGVIRALGGWFSDKWGGLTVSAYVFLAAIIISGMLMFPQLSLQSPGKGVLAKLPGTVVSVTENSVVVHNDKAGDRTYKFVPKKGDATPNNHEFMILPKKSVTQKAIVKAGDKVGKKQLLVKGTTNIFFQANVWVFGILAVFVGAIWGIGKASVYKLVPEFYPNEVGVVGGIVGVLGGLGGFFSPIIFGWLLDLSGLWSSAWMFVFVISIFAMFVLAEVRKKHSSIS